MGADKGTGTDSGRLYDFTGILSAAVEFSWLLFLLFVLKDWLLSAVDFYPYKESLIESCSLILATWVALSKQARGLLLFFSALSAIFLIFVVITIHDHRGALWAYIVFVVWTICLAGSIPYIRSVIVKHLAAGCLIVQTLFLALVWARDLPYIPWLDATMLGTGLGSRTLPVVYITEVTGSFWSANTTPLEAVVTEQGLLAVVSLILLVSFSAFAASLALLRIPESQDRWAVACAITVVDGMLLIGNIIPAFLTLETLWGTAALAVSLAVIGSALTQNKPDGEQQSLPVRPVGRFLEMLRVTLVIVPIGILALGFAVERRLHHMVLPLLSSDSILIPKGSPSEFTPISSIPQVMQDTTVAMEDGQYYEHHGIDWEAQHRALRFDLRLREIKQGGSTITEQLAKNLYLQNNDGSLGRKLEDIALAIEMERVLSKRRILELYLNTIDYGMGQHGIFAASAYYFHQKPFQLTMPEAAILVGTVPDPMHQQLDYERVSRGCQTAFGRLEFFYPRVYSAGEIDAAEAIPLDRLIYPEKDAWDRGATEEIPATWHGIGLYFFLDPETPEPIADVAPCLKDRLAGFLIDVHEHQHVVGIDHLGCYDDRSMRQSAAVISAHAYGQAIDISGFRFANGTEIKVSDHNNPRIACRLAPIEAMLKRHFDIVIDWRDDPLRHQTHFHCEVRGPRPTAQRRPDALVSDSGTLEDRVDMSSLVPEVEHVTFLSRFMGHRQWGFNVFIPPSYVTAKTRRYPVVYFCHGYGNDENTFGQGGFPIRLQEAMILGRSTDMIVVFMNGGKSSGFNQNGSSEMVESYVIKELIPYVDSHFRTISNRSGRAIEGFSMGGYGALKFACKYPDVFNNVVAYSAATWFSNRSDNNLDDLARDNVSALRKELRIRLVVGLAGDQTLNAMRHEHDLLDSLSIPNEYEEVPNVGHSFLGLYDADGGKVGIRGLDFHARSFIVGPELSTNVKATNPPPNG